MVDRLVAVDDADYRLPEPVLQALGTDMGNGSTAIGETLRESFTDQARMGIVLPEGPTYDELQAACDSAASFGTRVWAAGTIETDQTLTIRSDADLSGLLYRYNGSGVAVVVKGASDSAALTAKEIRAPRIRCGTKPGNGVWAAGTVGLRLLNLSACTVYVGQTYLFETGLEVASNVTGNVYNNIFLTGLDNNKVNCWIHPSNGGWVNNNTFYGGRMSHYSNEGIAVAGTKHIYITQDSGTIANMNMFINQSIETGPGIVEYGIDVDAGMYNVFVNPRIEANGAGDLGKIAVRWGANATRNVIRDGYSLNTKLKQVWAGGGANYIDSQGLVQHMAATTDPIRQYASTVSNTTPVLGIYEPATINQTVYNALTDWSMLHSASGVHGKRKADTEDRFFLDAQNGRLYFGSGTSASTRYIGNLGSNLAIVGGSLLFSAHNTYDVGSATFAPRYLYAGTAVKTGTFATGSRPTASSVGAGATIFDTTLNKPIWSTGSAWVDSTGAAV
jgi:hypothetical protein